MPIYDVLYLNINNNNMKKIVVEFWYSESYNNNWIPKGAKGLTDHIIDGKSYTAQVLITDEGVVDFREDLSTYTDLTFVAKKEYFEGSKEYENYLELYNFCKS